MPAKPPRQLLSLSLAIVVSTALFLTLLFSGQDPFVQAQTGETPTAEASPAVEVGFGTQNLPPIDGKLNPPKYANIDSNLNDIVRQYESGQSTAQVAAANAPIHSEESVAVTIYITEGYADAIADYLDANGASPRNIGADYIEAYVPVSLLPEASTQDGVINISAIIPPQPAQGTVVSEGAVVHGATAWHDAGLKGQGVKIGVIDNGFQGFRTLMGVEVPSNVEARCYTSIGSHTFNLSDCDNADESSHGTAVTEAVFDIAPQATYYIASPISGGDLLASVEWMIEHEVDVINMSLSWSWSGPGDGTSRFSGSSLRSVDAAVAENIVWVNSAGNEADNTWYGPFKDEDANNIHEFQGADECNSMILELGAGERLIAMLRWDDSWTAPSSDLDLYLLLIEGGQLRIASSAVTDQNETLRPFEWIRGAPTNGGEFCLAVFRKRGPIPAWIQLQAFTGQDLEYSVSERTIVEPADSANPGLLAVGAAPWNDTFTLERFSSRGPTHDGRFKPDVVGADRGQSAIRRSEDNPDGRWGGTSQSSAHVAGLAALVRQQFPEYTPGQVATYLKIHADARGTVPNNFWGYGFARLLASDASTPGPTSTPEPTATPEPSPTATATPVSGQATPTVTPTPTQPSVPSDVLNRLTALETLVSTLQGLISTLEGSISALNSSVSALANRVAALEADAPRHTPTPTPEPTVTPEPTATPTATPIIIPTSPTQIPTPVATAILEPTATNTPTSTLTPEPTPTQVPSNTGNNCLIDDNNGFSSPYILFDSWGDDSLHCHFFLADTYTGSFLKNVHALGFEHSDPGGATWTAILISLDEQPIDTYLVIIEYDPSKYNSFTEELGTFTEIASNNDHNGQPHVSQVTWTPRLGLSYLVIAAANSPCTEDHCPAAGGAFALTYESESELGSQSSPSLLRKVVSDNSMIQNLVIQSQTAVAPSSIREYIRNALRRWFSQMLDENPTLLLIDYFVENGFRIPWD